MDVYYAWQKRYKAQAYNGERVWNTILERLNCALSSLSTVQTLKEYFEDVQVTYIVFKTILMKLYLTYIFSTQSTTEKSK